MRTTRPKIAAVFGFLFMSVFASICFAQTTAVNPKILRIPELPPNFSLAGIRATMDSAVSLAGEGRSLELSFITDDDYYFGSLVIWMGNKHDKPFEVNSLSTVNAVLNELKLDSPSLRQEGIIYTIIGLLTRQPSTEGNRTGITLVGGSRVRLFKLLQKSISAGGLRKVEALLESPNIQMGTNAWVASWIEIDQLGGVERATATGISHPWKVTRLSRELLADEGTIPQEALNGGLLLGNQNPSELLKNK